MQTMAVPFPETNSFNADPAQAAAYNAGFSVGWRLLLDKGMGSVGASVSAPEMYQSPPSAKAWHAGYDAGTIEAYNRVAEKAGIGKFPAPSAP